MVIHLNCLKYRFMYTKCENMFVIDIGTLRPKMRNKLNFLKSQDIYLL